MEVQINRNKSILDEICLGCAVVDNKDNRYIVSQDINNGYLQLFDIKINGIIGRFSDLNDLKGIFGIYITKVINPNKVKILIEEE